MVNYFASLLASVGLGVGVVPATVTAPAFAPAAVPTTPVVTTMPSWPAVATVTDSYATLHASEGTSGGTGQVVPAVPTPTGPSSVSAVPAGAVGSGAQQMIDLINQARVAAGLPPYTVNATLMTLAAERAQALVTSGQFTHDLPGLGWPFQMEQAAGIRAQGMGAENIAEAGSVAQAFQLLMASPEHRANILNPYETQIGVGVYPLPNGVAISELFIGPNM
jgi:uncharacterized protein YkwD